MPGTQKQAEKSTDAGQQHGGRNIVIFSDGTGNSAAKLSKTNVWRMFQALEKGPGENPRQISIYDNGVGTSTFRPLMLLGGIFGVGLKRNVCQLYSFLCTHYRDGDRIFMFGFSRGAFTIRYLAAMVTSQGILKVGPGDNEVAPTDVNKYARLTFTNLRKAFEPQNFSDDVFGSFRKYALFPFRWIWHRAKYREPLEDHLRRQPHWPSPLGSTLGMAQSLDAGHSAEIEFLGLFDTVSAYGGPFEELTAAWAKVVTPIEPNDWNISSNVRRVCHALALDDPRQTFHPKLINEGLEGTWSDPATVPSPEEEPKKHIDEERVSQVWFSGAHSNVGGGYPNDGMSFVALNWMIKRVNKKLYFDPDLLKSYREREDAAAPLYDPRKGPGGAYRYNPRDLSRLTENFPKIHVDRPKIHQSVFDRIQNNPGYAPISITKPYDVVGSDGRISPGHKHDFAAPSGQSFDGRATASLPLGQSDRWNFALQKVWDLVWWKRVYYFATLFVALALVLMPYLSSVPYLKAFLLPPETACVSWHCSLTIPLDWLKHIVPGFLDRWIDSWRVNGLATAVIVLAIYFLISKSSSLRKKINTGLSEYWSQVLNGKPPSNENKKRSPVHKFRHNGAYQSVLRSLKISWIPNILAILILIAGALLFNKVLFAARNAVSGTGIAAFDLCPDTRWGRPGQSFDLRSGCHDTGYDLVRNERYRVTIEKKGEWVDKTIKASLIGLHLDETDWWTRLKMKTATVIRRHISQPWFKPVLRVGDALPDNYALEPLNGKASPDRLVAEIDVQESGRARLYFNDAIFGFLPAYRLYENNHLCPKGEAVDESQRLAACEKPVQHGTIEICRIDQTGRSKCDPVGKKN